MTKQQEVEEKVERLTRLLAAENLGGVLLTGQHNFAWATAGGRSAIDESRDAGACALFVRADGHRFVIADCIEMPRLLTEELKGLDYEPIEYGWEDDKINPALVVEHARKLMTEGAELAADLPIGDARIIETQVARTRYRLTDGELERFRALGHDAGATVAAVARGLEPGLSEREVARRVTDALATHDIQTFVTLVAADERLTGFRHPVPTTKRWEKIVMIVVCARRAGLIASLTRIVCAGSGVMTEDLQMRTQATAAVNAALFAKTKPGATGKELYEVARREYAANGFEGEQHKHHQGGAAGYRPRDWVAHPACDEVVVERQAFAWNPSITGTKTEETCIVMDGEIEVITESPKWNYITVERDGREYRLPDVMSL